MQKAPARAQPASLVPTAPAGAGTATGRTKVSRAAVAPTAAWGLTAPARSTAKPKTSMPITAVAAWKEHSVPTVTSSVPVAKRIR